jgi:hypothetical protein
LFDKFEIQKDSMFSVKYYDNFTLYTDSEHTNVYDDGTGSIDPVNDDLTLYLIRNP